MQCRTTTRRATSYFTDHQLILEQLTQRWNQNFDVPAGIGPGVIEDLLVVSGTEHNVDFTDPGFDPNLLFFDPTLDANYDPMLDPNFNGPFDPMLDPNFNGPFDPTLNPGIDGTFVQDPFYEPPPEYSSGDFFEAIANVGLSGEELTGSFEPEISGFINTE